MAVNQRHPFASTRALAEDRQASSECSRMPKSLPDFNCNHNSCAMEACMIIRWSSVVCQRGRRRGHRARQSARARRQRLSYIHTSLRALTNMMEDVAGCLLQMNVKTLPTCRMLPFARWRRAVPKMRCRVAQCAQSPTNVHRPCCAVASKCWSSASRSILFYENAFAVSGRLSRFAVTAATVRRHATSDQLDGGAWFQIFGAAGCVGSGVAVCGVLFTSSSLSLLCLLLGFLLLFVFCCCFVCDYGAGLLGCGCQCC